MSYNAFGIQNHIFSNSNEKLLSCSIWDLKSNGDEYLECGLLGYDAIISGYVGGTRFSEGNKSSTKVYPEDRSTNIFSLVLG
jgi:hypothetical protein